MISTKPVQISVYISEIIKGSLNAGIVSLSVALSTSTGDYSQQLEIRDFTLNEIIVRNDCTNFNKISSQIISISHIDDDPLTSDIVKLIAQNPAFDFLKSPAEDIYTINDGEPI